MSLLIVSSVTLRMGGRTLLEGADLTVDAGRRIGLVGRNGAGKSTLLKAISGDLAVDGGDIRLASRARMAQVKQTAPSGPKSLLDTVLEGDQERLALLAEAEEAERGHIPPERVAAIWERLGAIDADTAPSRAATILSGLGFDTEAQARPLDEFSGGWRMRVALATVLFSNPDLLLLDEPTNHLDLEATLWLEAWLARFAGAALVVSHDQGLLNRSVQAIAHLDQRRLSVTPGGYSEFVRIRTEQAMLQAKAAVKIQAQRAHMQAFVDRFRASASKARQAQSRIKALEKMPVIDSVIEDSVTKFNFPEPKPLPPPILSLDGVAVGYGGPPVLSALGMNFQMGDRIALLGANGNGKSTFAKLIAGRLEPSAGNLRRPGKLRVGYFAQHQEAELDPHGSALDHMARALPDQPGTVHRSQCARFGLDRDRALTPTGSLSGGERARLLLALATRDAPQLLILDEPTNHLDIDACDALVRALSEFSGAVLLITHDPNLVELVADTLWIVSGGTIAPYEGDMEDYRELLLKKPAKAPKVGASKKDERKARAKARQESVLF
jgi:ATP-binding cassette subfamily F protein 3